MRRKTAYERAYARVRVALLTEETRTTILDHRGRPMTLEAIEGSIDETQAAWRAERPEGGCICTGEDGEPDCPTHGHHTKET